MILFACAGLVVAGALAVITLAAYELAHTTVYVTVSAVLAAVTGAATGPLWAAAYRNARDPAVAAPVWLLFVGAAYIVSVETLYIWNAFTGGKAGPLIAALSLSLLYGLWVFIRLLVVPTSPAESGGEGRSF